MASRAAPRPGRVGREGRNQPTKPKPKPKPQPNQTNKPRGFLKLTKSSSPPTSNNPNQKVEKIPKKNTRACHMSMSLCPCLYHRDQHGHQWSIVEDRRAQRHGHRDPQLGTAQIWGMPQDAKHQGVQNLHLLQKMKLLGLESLKKDFVWMSSGWKIYIKC